MDLLNTDLRLIELHCITFNLRLNFECEWDWRGASMGYRIG